jgi:hypothetical protein
MTLIILPLLAKQTMGVLPTMVISQLFVCAGSLFFPYATMGVLPSDTACYINMRWFPKMVLPKN